MKARTQAACLAAADEAARFDWEERRRSVTHAMHHLAGMDPERRAQLEREWEAAEAEVAARMDRAASAEIIARAKIEWEEM